MGGMYIDAEAQVMAPLQSSRSFVFYPDSLPQQLLELPVPETVVFTAFDNNSIVLNSYFGIGHHAGTTRMMPFWPLRGVP